MRSRRFSWAVAAALSVAFVSTAALAQDKPPPSVEEKAAAAPDAQPSRQELIKKLEKTLTGCKFDGQFTIEGKKQQTVEGGSEEYTITSAQKLPEGDLWLIKARIKYGKTDSVVPIPLEIKWAGDTPVITMTRMTIPKMGTFSARVVLYDGRYAGTWQHDSVGGHLYGTLRPATEAEAQEAEKKAE